jgi:hypothetical protein
MENLVEAPTAPPVSQGHHMPTRSFPASTPRPRSPPQAILNAFQGAVDRAENLRRMQIGREVVGIAACVAKLISAERQRCVHILAAADLALAELQG